MSQRTALEEYYREKYARQQFVFESSLQGLSDLRITDGNEVAGKDILVIGVNKGDDVAFLTKNNDVKGIDIMSEAVEAAKRQKIDAMQMDVEKGLPFEADQFDIVVCKEVLEHLLDPAFVMSEIHRVLKKDGYAFISVPNHFWYYFRFRILFGKGLVMPLHSDTAWHDWDYFHIRFFTFKGFKGLIRKTKFTIVKIYYQETVSDVFAPGKLRRIDKVVPKRLCRFLVKSKPNLFSRDFAAKISKDNKKH